MDSLNKEQAWQATLKQLKLQLTGATFNTWLNDCKLLPSDSETFRLVVKNEYAKDWLENRLADSIRRTLAAVLGADPETIELEFVVQDNGDNDHPPAPEIRMASLRQPDLHLVPPPHQLTVGLAEVDYDALWNATGYAKLPHYINRFWRLYLGRSFELWLYLQAQVVSGSGAQSGWLPPKKHTLTQMASALKCSINSIKGCKEMCYHLRNSVNFEQPLSECCHKFDHAGAQWTGADGDSPPCCHHWRTGMLETLFDAGLVAVEEIKAPNRPRAHVLKLQVWRRLPLLTPAQVATLKEIDQLRHEQWLERYGHRADPPISLSDWEAETRPSLLPHLPGYTADRRLFDVYRPSEAFKTGQT